MFTFSTTRCNITLIFRLQTLRECVYQASTKTCTCFAGIMDHRSLDHDGRSPNNHTKDTEIDISSSKLIRNKAKVPYEMGTILGVELNNNSS